MLKFLRKKSQFFRQTSLISASLMGSLEIEFINIPETTVTLSFLQDVKTSVKMAPNKITLSFFMISFLNGLRRNYIKTKAK